MDVRSFYWDPSAGRPWYRLKKRSFRVGNAGDIFNVDLLKWAYPGIRVKNVPQGDQRLFLVGSVIHKAVTGDLINGVGTKTEDLPPAPAGIRVRGVRGPRTLAAVEKAGYDVSDIRFFGDPGLLIGKMFPELADIRAENGRAIFIPHYKERAQFQDTADYSIVDIDARPLTVAQQICRAEVVYTSSLHGAIWAHALGRPTALVMPRTAEPQLKYADYYESVGSRLAPADDIHAAVRTRPFELPEGVGAVVDGISLPTLEELVAAGIAR